MTKLPRGTVTTRVKTARLQPGDLVLTTPAASRPGTPGVPSNTVQPQQTKTGALVREVASLEAVPGLSIGRNRAQRTYTVHFSDGTRSERNAPSYTWHGVPGTLANLIAKV